MLKQKSFIIIAVAAIVAATLACGKTDSNKSAGPAANTSAVADFSAPLRLSATDADAAEPGMAASTDGTVYLVWVEHKANKQADLWLRRLDQNGNALSQPVRINPQGGEASAWRGDPPTIAIAKDGAIHVGWTARSAPTGHSTNILLSTSRDGGQSFGPPVKVNDDSEPVVHGMHSLAVDGEGRIFVAWLDERNVKMETPDGKAKMDEHKMEANRELYVATSSDGGRTFSENRLVGREACPCCKTALAIGGDGRVYVAWRQVLPGNYRHIAVASSTDAGRTFSEPVIASDDKWMIAGCPVSGPALATAADNALRVLWYSGGEAGSHGLYWSETRDGGKSFTQRRALVEGAAFGNPQLIAGPGNTLTAVWESSEKEGPKIVLSSLDNAGAPSVKPLPDRGQLPSAAATRDQLFITYIIKQDQQRSIWLVRAKTIA